MFAQDDEDDVEQDDGSFLKVYKKKEGEQIEAEKKLTAD
jgi:hypothetical protein